MHRIFFGGESIGKNSLNFPDLDMHDFTPIYKIFSLKEVAAVIAVCIMLHLRQLHCRC